MNVACGEQIINFQKLNDNISDFLLAISSFSTSKYRKVGFHVDVKRRTLLKCYLPRQNAVVHVMKIVSLITSHF